MEGVWRYLTEVLGKDVAGYIEKFYSPFKPPNLFSDVHSYLMYLFTTLQCGMIVRLLPGAAHKDLSPGTEVMYLFWATDDNVKSMDDLVAKVLYKGNVIDVGIFDIEIVGYGMTNSPFFTGLLGPKDPTIKTHNDFSNIDEYEQYLLQTLQSGTVMRVHAGEGYGYTKTGTLTLFLEFSSRVTTNGARILFIDKHAITIMRMDVKHADAIDVSACKYSIF